jgi:D-glycero-D-manno-heptose 1,7-bisphosphate phosphatase
VLKLHKYINFVLKKNGASIDQFYFCPHHIEGRIQRYKLKCNCRKPKNGQFEKIKAKWNINMKKSFMIGDQKTDMEFAKKSNLKGYLFKEKNLFNYISKKLI